MKRLFTLLTLGFFFFTGCQEENDITTKEAVHFTLDVSTSNDGRTDADLPDNISVEMTLASGAEEITKSVNFSKTGNSYFSESVELPLGTYKLKDFVVDNEDLAAIPGLPQNFSVGGNERKNISIGQINFHSRGAQPLHIAVYTEGEMTKLTDAKVTIFYHEGDRFVYDRSGTIHNVVLKGDANAWYTLIVEKQGYEIYRLTFTY